MAAAVSHVSSAPVGLILARGVHAQSRSWSRDELKREKSRFFPNVIVRMLLGVDVGIGSDFEFRVPVIALTVYLVGPRIPLGRPRARWITLRLSGAAEALAVNQCLTMIIYVSLQKRAQT